MLTLAIRCANQLINKYKAYRHADQRVDMLVVRLEAIWVRSMEQIIALRDIWNSLPAPYQIHQKRVLQILCPMLQNALLSVEQLTESTPTQKVVLGYKLNPLRRWKKAEYSLIEASLCSTIEDLESWRRRFDPSWYLIIRIASAMIDSTLAKSSRGASNPLSSVRLIREELNLAEARRSRCFDLLAT